MKKIISLVLTVLMLISCTAAVAEELTVQTLTVDNVQFLYNDQSALDLSGLSLSLSGAGSAETFTGMGQISVSAAHQNVASAKLAYVDGKLVASVDGLSKPLYVDVAQLVGQYMSQMSTDDVSMALLGVDSESAMKLVEAVTALFSEDSMTAVSASLETYKAKIQEIIASAEVVSETKEYTFVKTGETAEAEYMSITLSAENIRAIMTAAAEMYDSNPAVLNLFNTILEISGAEKIESVSGLVGSNLDTLNASVTIEQYAGTTEFDVIVTVNGAEEQAVQVVCAMYNDGANSAVDVSIYANEQNTLTLTYLAVPSEAVETEMETTVTVEIVNEGETSSASLWVGPDTTFGHVANLVVNNTDGTSVGFSVAYGDQGYIVTVYNDENSVEFGFVPSGDADATVYAKYAMGSDAYVVSVDGHITSSVIDSSEIESLLTADAIDVMNITDEDMEALQSEAYTLAMTAVSTLMSNVPGIMALFSTEY